MNYDSMKDFEQGENKEPMDAALNEMKKVSQSRQGSSKKDVQVDISPIVEKISALNVTSEVANQVNDVVAKMGNDNASVSNGLHEIATLLEPKKEVAAVVALG